MSKQKFTLPAKDRILLLRDLRHLQRVCFLSERPIFTFKKSEDFSELDALHYGNIGNCYTIPPAELKNIWEDQQTLRDNQVDYIQSRRMKWYYNIQFPEGEFYSEDGQKKVSVSFDFWVDTEKVWKVPGVKKALQQVLNLCEGDTFPSQSDTQACFSEALCRKIYEMNPQKETHEQLTLEMMEHLRKAVLAQLVQNNSSSIQKKQDFQKWVAGDLKRGKLSVIEQVRHYLKENKNAVYLFGEEFGYIKRAHKMIRYQMMRDHVRHPNEVGEVDVFPKEMYQDFCAALGIKKPLPLTTAPLGYLGDHKELVDHIAQMSEILDILHIHADKRLKKKDPAYWQDLVQKGIIQAKDIPLLQQKSEEYRTVAHGQAGADTLKSKLADDTKIMDLNWDICEAHQKWMVQLLRNQER